MTGGRIPRASGMKPVLQRSAEVLGSGPIAIAVGGVQPAKLSSDSSLVHGPVLPSYPQAAKLSKQLVLSGVS